MNFIACVGLKGHKTLHVSLKRSRLQRGLTLVELLVALANSGFIAIAAVSSLIVTRRGFRTIDGASQMRDEAR